MADCICVRRGDGPEGCGICNETGTTPDIAGLCERLRDRVALCKDCGGVSTYDEDDCALDTEAADTLERQAAEIERLRKALWPFAQVKPTAAKGFVNICALNVDVIEAQAALTGEDHD